MTSSLCSARSIDDKIDSPKLTVLDVGHGNCTVVFDDSSTVVVDAGAGSVLMEFLRSKKIFSIDSIVISHADFDHIGGLIAIFSSQMFTVGEIWINSDAIKNSQAWESLRFEIQDLEESGKLRVNGSLCRGDLIRSDINNLRIDTLSPRRAMALQGPNGSSITPNTMSAVLKVSYDGRPVALLPGDMDAFAFEQLIESKQSLKADYLVLPHHGGRWGGGKRLEEVVKKLCEMVEPREVIVSNGRGKFDNPRPEVISSVTSTIPDAHVSCTQLSNSCAPTLPKVNNSLDLTVFSAGRELGKCCAGSIVFDLSSVQGGRDYRAHDQFVDTIESTALCRRKISNGSE